MSTDFARSNQTAWISFKLTREEDLVKQWKIGIMLYCSIKKCCEGTKRITGGFQHFSLNHSQTIDFTGIFTDFKSVLNSGVFKVFVRPFILLKSEGERGRNAKKLFCKIGKIFEGCLPH